MDQCQSGVWLASAVLGGKSGRTEAGDQVVAGCRRARVRRQRLRLGLHSIEVAQPPRGTIHIEFRQDQVRIEYGADRARVRVLLECLRAQCRPTRGSGLRRA
jgi:hypothetical protein